MKEEKEVEVPKPGMMSVKKNAATVSTWYRLSNAMSRVMLYVGWEVHKSTTPGEGRSRESGSRRL